MRKPKYFIDGRAISVGLLGLLLLALCIAGGASQATEFGQVVIRTFAIIAMLILCMTRRSWTLFGVGWPMALIAFAAAIALVQLIPLPPAVWAALPGRAPFQAAIMAGDQPWRPINLTPDSGLNALFSLVVPTATLAILSGLDASARRTVVNLLLFAVLITASLGSIQLAGAGFDNPLINETGGLAAGIFANRNHQALLLACGMPLLGGWLSMSGDTIGRPQLRLFIGAGIMIWLLFLILATGSRAGIVLAALGLVAAIGSASLELRTFSADWTRRQMFGFLTVTVVLIGGVVALGIESERALSLTRLLSSDEAQDFRTSSLPVSWQLVTSYFPFGSGLGSFNSVFRIAEPTTLLSPLYFNHAHNDVLEIVIEAGVMGAFLVGFAAFIWVRLGVRAWRETTAGSRFGICGWWILTLIAIASLVDYPLRTPTMMAFAAVAAWLSYGRQYEDEVEA